MSRGERTENRRGSLSREFRQMEGKISLCRKFVVIGGKDGNEEKRNDLDQRLGLGRKRENWKESLGR